VDNLHYSAGAVGARAGHIVYDGRFVHILLVIALVVLAIRVIQGRMAGVASG
jgi:hypothetical protein